MKYHVIAALVACAFAGALSAQATININDSVSDMNERLFKFDVDFGPTAQSVTVTLTIQATSGTSGLDVNLVDLDELAANGTTNAIANDFDSGTGSMTLNLTTPTYSGVHQFAVQLRTDSGVGTSPFNGDLGASALATGAITQTGSLTIPFGTGYFDLLDRGGRNVIQNTAAGTFTRDVQVDFGSVPQAITFWVQAIYFEDGTLEIYEVPAAGGETLLNTLTLNTGNGWEDEINLTTSIRSGIVTLRFKIQATMANFHIWQLILPGVVASVSSGGGSGGGGGDGGGCSTGDHSDLAWLGLLAIIGAIGLATRLRS